MEVEFTRPLVLPASDAIELQPGETYKLWLSWGIYKLGNEQELSSYTYGATFEDAAVELTIPMPPEPIVE